MTATPHKGDPDNLRPFLKLLDKDVYGDIRRLEEAMREHVATFYLRRIKKAPVTFPDAETGEEVVPSVDPAALRDEIARLVRLIDEARALEVRDINYNIAWNPVRLEQPPRLESLDVQTRRPEHVTDGNF